MAALERDMRLLSVFEAARITGLKPATWRRYIQTRKVPSVRIGRAVRIPESAIAALIREGWRPAVTLEESAR